MVKVGLGQGGTQWYVKYTRCVAQYTCDTPVYWASYQDYPLGTLWKWWPSNS